jgi:hypothetical protein
MAGTETTALSNTRRLRDAGQGSKGLVGVAKLQAIALM